MQKETDRRTAGQSRNCLAVLTVRNEGAFLLQWLAHHCAVGFNRILVFSNGCNDGTDTMLDRLQELGWLTHLRNDGPYHARGVQFTALKAAQNHDLVRGADWILPLDIDEFVNVKTGDNTLSALFSALPQATAITLTWRLFGNSGEKRFKDQPVTERFTRCAPEIINWPWRAVMFKTLYRNDDSYSALGVHRPRSPKAGTVAQTRWFDGEGHKLDTAFQTKRIFSNYGQPNYRMVQLNHYPLGSMEDFVLKADRGRAVHAEDQLGLDYWTERNFTQDTDTSISAVRERTEKTRQNLLKDKTLSALHKRAVEWRKYRFEELMRHDQYRSLFGRLLMAAPSRLVDVQDAQFMISCALKGTDSSNQIT